MGQGEGAQAKFLNFNELKKQINIWGELSDLNCRIENLDGRR